MTVTAITNKAVFTGNGVTTSFPFTFKVNEEDDLQVYEYVIATGVLTLVDDANYSIVGTLPGTGSVTYNPAGVPLPATKRLVLIRIVPYTQDLDISNQGGFHPDSIEDQLDLLEMQIQQLSSGIMRRNPADTGDLLDQIIAVDDSGYVVGTGETIEEFLADVAATAAAAVAAAASAAAAAGSAVDAAASADEAEGFAQDASDFADVASGSAANAVVAQTQAELAALAAGAPLYDAVPGDFTGVESPFLVSTEAGVAVYTHDGATATLIGWLGKVLFPSLSILLQSTTTLGPEDQIIEAAGHRYKVAATAAADHHLTTAGGVKLYVMPAEFGTFAIDAFTLTTASDNAAIFQGVISAATSSEGGTWGRRRFSGNLENLIPLEDELLIDTDTISIEGFAMMWEGAAAANVITLRNTPRSQVRDSILLGNKDAIPQSLIYLRADDLATSNNENILIEGVVFNKRATSDTTTGGSADTTPNFESQFCILIGGVYSGNNDEFVIRNCQFHNATVACASIEEPQSIWGLWDNCLFNDGPIGLLAGGNTTLRHCTFNRLTTADIDAFRDIDVWVDGMHAENSIIFGRSTQGASLYVRNGKLLRNNAVASTFFDVQSGGSLVLENLLIDNAGGSGDTIKWRAGTTGGTRQIISVRNCEIKDGAVRSTWDIHTAALGGVIVPEIDIEQGAFKFKTKMPYIDVALDAASIANAASALVSTGSAGTLARFYNVSAGVDLQDMQATVAHDSASVMRARIMNQTGGAIDLASTRWRWMDLSEHIGRVSGATIDLALLANGAGNTQTIAAPGFRMGDFVVWSANAAFTSISACAYMNADGSVTMRFHNQSGGNSDAASMFFSVAALREFGNFTGWTGYAGATIPTGTLTSISVPVPGAQYGSHAFFSYSGDLGGLFVTAEARTDVVKVAMFNSTGGDVIVPAGIMRAMVAF